MKHFVISFMVFFGLSLLGCRGVVAAKQEADKANKTSDSILHEFKKIDDSLKKQVQEYK